MSCGEKLIQEEKEWILGRPQFKTGGQRKLQEKKKIQIIKLGPSRGLTSLLAGLTTSYPRVPRD